MKICTKSCALAVVLGGGSLLTMLNGQKRGIMKAFKDSLSEAQSKIYQEITKKRRNLYCQGLMLGLVLSALFLIYRRRSLMTVNTICLTVAITLTVSYLHYMLSQKGEYMLSHLTSKDQTEKWLAIYRVMQYNYNLGIVLGILAVIAASQTVCA